MNMVFLALLKRYFMSRKLLIGIIISIVSPALAGLLETALHNVIWTDQWHADPTAQFWAALDGIDPNLKTGAILRAEAVGPVMVMMFC